MFEKAAPAAVLGILCFCSCSTEPKETVMPEVSEYYVVEAGAGGGTYTLSQAAPSVLRTPMLLS